MYGGDIEICDCEIAVAVMLLVVAMSQKSHF